MPELNLETRKEIARLRKLFPVNPNEMHLFTRQVEGVTGISPDYHHERWLSDRYVMVNVTDSRALHVDLGPDYPDGGELMDGGYKLTAGKGLVPDADIFLPNTAGLLDQIESDTDARWEEMHRTNWAVNESDAKLGLFYTRTGSIVEPWAMNEGIWKAFQDAYPPQEGGACLTFEASAAALPFRVRDYHGVTIAYVARGSFVQCDKDEALRVAEVVAR